MQLLQVRMMIAAAAPRRRKPNPSDFDIYAAVTSTSFCSTGGHVCKAIHWVGARLSMTMGGKDPVGATRCNNPDFCSALKGLFDRASTGTADLAEITAGMGPSDLKDRCFLQLAHGWHGGPMLGYRGNACGKEIFPRRSNTFLLSLPISILIN